MASTTNILACLIVFLLIHIHYNMVHNLLVYVIVWVAVIFGINCASNAGRKPVIVRGAAEHYYCVLPALLAQLIPNTTGKPYCYKLIQYVCVVVSTLVKRCGHVVHFTK